MSSRGIDNENIINSTFFPLPLNCRHKNSCNIYIYIHLLLYFFLPSPGAVVVNTIILHHLGNEGRHAGI